MTSDASEELTWLERARELCKPPTLIGADEVLRAAALETDFLVPQRIPFRMITFFAGKPGTAKSWLAYGLAMATARDTTWLGMPVMHSGPVLILNYDNPNPELGRRFMRMGLEAGDPIYFHSVEKDPLLLPEHDRHLLALRDHVSPVLIVIDSFRRAHTSDENDSKAMAAIMGNLRLLARDAAVIVIHHTSKNSEAEGVDKMRGAGEIVGSADAAVFVSEGAATWEKHRAWKLEPEDATLPFRLVDDGELTYLEGE